MTNYMVIEQATKLTSEYFAIVGAAVTDAVIRGQVESWYNHTDYSDPYVLSACVIEYGYYTKYIGMVDENSLVERYYPEIYYENTLSKCGHPQDISICEIEEAERDEMRGM